MFDSRAGTAWIIATAIIGLSGAIVIDQSAFAQTLPKFDIHNDPAGQMENYQPKGSTPLTNEFFQSLGTNGRTCETCHEPADAFSLSTADIQNTYNLTNGTDPLFASVDGANCPDQPSNSNLLLNYGLIRILLPISPKTFTGTTPNFTLTSVSDPNNCQTQNATVQADCVAKYGAGYTCISVYRRPLPTTNLGSQSTIMWDGREPSPITAGLTASLNAQATDAVLTHSQGTSAPTSQQLADIVAFETGVFTTQTIDNSASILNALGANESPQYLSSLKFQYGENNNKAGNFNTNVFTLYKAWSSISGTDPVSLARESVYRGETIFNTRVFSVGALSGKKVACSFCHNDPNNGNNSNSKPNMLTRIGTDNPADSILESGTYLPTFAFTCNDGTQTLTTDPGEGIIDGQCSDLEKVKIPTLHGLAARAPYFRNGSAPDLATVVNFYNQRFSIGLSAQDQLDLANFLNTL